ncbi:Peroxidasin [Orchesella cincta]|uniref:Peroxidasin n=1 Tax=Orchesella cincta TaxID=48709 RepID=A0A1D2MXZ3_ORCCI|nr:Peroxidasin [Orchesella cincta]
MNFSGRYLHYNYIQEFSGETFQNLSSLQRLFLHNNRIQRIPTGAFDGLTKIIRLRLDSNALICDCSIMSLAQMLAEHPDAEAAAYCEQPLSMHGKSVMTINDLGIRCRKPKITEEPRDIEVNFGNTVYFRCRAEGEPDPNIIWLRNSTEVQPRYSVLRDGTLMIANTQDEDVGTYECVAKSEAGLVKSRKAKMLHSATTERHAMRPRLIQVPLDQEVTEGSNLTVNCEASGFPQPKITWYLDSSPLPVSPRHRVSERGSLTILNVSKDDGGVYRCTASNLLGNLSAVSEVRVATAPKWLVTPLNQTASFGDRVEFKCESVGTPFPATTWLHNGQPLRNDRFRINEDGTLLTINPVAEGDEGEISCRAENGLGQIEAVVGLRVSSGTSPIFTDFIQNQSFSVTRGSQIRLPCAAAGVPPPTIIWRKNHLTILENLKTSLLPSGTLILNEFDPVLDEGTYSCAAFNDHGFVTAPQIIIRGNRISVIQEENQITVENELITNAFQRARNDVETAESDSLDSLFSNTSRQGFRTPIDLLRLSRFPRLEGRRLARPAEIYERAIQIIHQEINKGMNFTLASSGDFSYEHIQLSPAQLELLGRLSGCISHKEPEKANCTQDRCFHSKYRSIDGTCNNMAKPMWGASYTPFQRLIKPEYENGFNLPRGWDPQKPYNGLPLPSARVITNKVITTENISPDSTYTHMLMQWGQFLDHDMDHALPSLSIESFGQQISCRRTCENVAPCFPMQAPQDDLRIRTRKCMEFTRSAAVCGSGVTSILFNNMQQREQINQLTSFIDGSQVYGSSKEELLALRNSTSRAYLRNGIYILADKPLMPFATDDNWVDCRRNFRESDVGCFLAGDIRSNEQLGLLAMHTIWFRQHNFLASKLRSLNPLWDQDIVFQEARKIVGAQMQHITYAEWLPYVIGKQGMAILGPYTGYNPQINPTITNEFATAALRFGHTLINPTLRRLDSSFQTIREGDVPLRSAFFAPWRLVEEGGVDPLMRGLFTTPAKLKTPTQILNSHLTNELFGHAHLVALDLASMNIQRGRDHGIPSYNEYRVRCNLTRAASFEDLKNEIPDADLRRKLAEVYGNVDNIDLWVGGVAEQPPTPDSRVGPTFQCILIDQFRRLRDGDRFWYENPSTFRPEQLTQIKQSTLARVLCDNGDSMSHIKRDVFLMDSGLVNCRLIPSVQLSFWSNTDCCGDGGGGSRSGSCSRNTCQRSLHRGK